MPSSGLHGHSVHMVHTYILQTNHHTCKVKTNLSFSNYAYAMRAKTPSSLQKVPIYELTQLQSSPKNDGEEPETANILREEKKLGLGKRLGKGADSREDEECCSATELSKI